LSDLLAPSTGTKDFKCQLEYLLFRAGLFHLQPTNINNHHICTNHLDHFLSASEKVKRCSSCVPIRDRRSASVSGLRRACKAVALGIWEEGRPHHSWVLFGRLICATCRLLFEEKYSNDAMRKKCDELFGKCHLL